MARREKTLCYLIPEFDTFPDKYALNDPEKTEYEFLEYYLAFIGTSPPTLVERKLRRRDAATGIVVDYVSWDYEVSHLNNTGLELCSAQVHELFKDDNVEIGDYRVIGAV